MSAPAQRPAILYLVLASHRSAERARAVLETWGRALSPWDRLVFVGDDLLEKDLGPERCWACVRANTPEDRYEQLPRKMLEAWRRARALVGWDFCVKVDDDTFVVPSRMRAILEELAPSDALHAGGWGGSMEAAEIAERHLLRGDTSFRFDVWVGGAGYAVTRPALERAFPELERELAAPGPEDFYLGAAMRRAGVRQVKLPALQHQERRMDLVAYGAFATIHRCAPDDLRFLDLLTRDLELPFDVADCASHWGTVGLNGALGYEGQRVIVEGRPRRRAISAHADAHVLLRAPAGLELQLMGVLNDTVPGRAAPRARFTAHHRGGGDLADLGHALPGTPTPTVTVRVPSDGRLLLRISCPEPTCCHSVWLWNAPGWAAKAR